MRAHRLALWTLSAVLLGVTLSISAPIHGQGSGSRVAPKTTKITLEPGQLHLGKSRAFVFVGKTGLGHEHAVEGRLRSGEINLAAVKNLGELVFDMNTFDADGDDARKYLGLKGSTPEGTRQQVNANMRGRAVLDIATHPTATFEITHVTKAARPNARGRTQYDLDGQFTLCGKRRPIRVVAEAEELDSWIHLRGSFAILQTEFGITPFSKVGGLVGVADRLQIHGDFWIARTQLEVEQ